MLNEEPATEVVCVLRYKRHYFMAKGLASQSVAQEFLEDAKEEEQQAEDLVSFIDEIEKWPPRFGGRQTAVADPKTKARLCGPLSFSAQDCQAARCSPPLPLLGIATPSGVECPSLEYSLRRL